MVDFIQSFTNWLCRKRLESLNEQAKKKLAKKTVNWNDYPCGVVLSCCVLDNGVVSGTLRDSSGKERQFTTYKADISSAIPAGAKVAYIVRPPDVRPRIKVLKVLSETPNVFRS